MSDLVGVNLRGWLQLAGENARANLEMNTERDATLFTFLAGPPRITFILTTRGIFAE